MTKTFYPQANNDPNDYYIVADSDQFVTDNFMQRELYNPKIGQAHPISKQVVACVQLLRMHFDVPIRINSTYRNYVPTGGANPSTHMLAQAIDFSFISDHADQYYIQLREDFDNKGTLFQALFDLGCRGFGSYDTFVHLDTTQAELYPAFEAKRWRTYEGEKYGRWNKMKTLRHIEPNQSVSSTNPLSVATGVLSGIVAELQDGEDRGDDKDSRLFFIIGIGIVVLGITTWGLVKLMR